MPEMHGDVGIGRQCPAIGMQVHNMGCLRKKGSTDYQ
jgi:hypothetical protein